VLVERCLRAPLRELDEAVVADGGRADLNGLRLAVIGDRRIHPFGRVDAGEGAGAFLDAGLVDLQPVASQRLQRLGLDGSSVGFLFDGKPEEHRAIGVLGDAVHI
jgi:hypothetical protein